MSAHIWNNQRFTKETLDNALMIALFAHKKGLDFDGVCSFTGYAIESKRQKGGMWRFQYNQSLGESRSLNLLWASVLRSKHRYTKGKNKYNNRIGGMKMIAAMADRVGLDEGTEAWIVFTKLIEEQINGKD